MTSKLKTDILETVSGSGTIALTNQLSGMTSASVPQLTAAQMPVGSVLQVKTQNYIPSGNSSTTSTSYVNTGLVMTITPTSTNSKILVIATVGSQSQASVTNNLAIFRDSTQVTEPLNVATSSFYKGPLSLQAEDSPSSTSELTYRIKAKVSAGTFYYHHSAMQNAITLMEIKG